MSIERTIVERLMESKHLPDSVEMNSKDMRETVVVGGNWYWKSNGKCWTQPTDKSKPRQEIEYDKYREICKKAKEGNVGSDSEVSSKEDTSKPVEIPEEISSMLDNMRGFEDSQFSLKRKDIEEFKPTEKELAKLKKIHDKISNSRTPWTVADKYRDNVRDLVKNNIKNQESKSASKMPTKDNSPESTNSKAPSSEMSDDEVNKYVGEWTEKSGDEALDNAYSGVRKSLAAWRKSTEALDKYADKLENKLRKERGAPSKRARVSYATMKKFKDVIDDIKKQVRNSPEYTKLYDEATEARVNFEDTTYAFKDTFKDAKSRGVKYPHDYYVASTEMDDYD